MGQESSSLVDESTPPETLAERSIEAVAKLIRQSRAKKIVVLVSIERPKRAVVTQIHHRQAQGSQRPPAYPISVVQVLACMRTLQNSNYPTQKQCT